MKTVEQIIQEQMPNMRIVATAAADASTKRRVGRTSRSMDALKKKYAAHGYQSGSEEEESANTDDDVQIVTVAPADASVAAGGPGTKSVVVSTKEGKIIGSQG
jgi:hypothetical protein